MTIHALYSLLMFWPSTFIVHVFKTSINRVILCLPFLVKFWDFGFWWEAEKTVTTEHKQRREPTTNSTHVMMSMPGFETGPHLWEASTLTAALSLDPFLHWFHFVLQMVTCWDNVCCRTEEKCLHLWQQWHWTPLPKKPSSSEQIRVFTLSFPSCLSGKWSFSKHWQHFLVSFSN